MTSIQARNETLSCASCHVQAQADALIEFSQSLMVFCGGGRFEFPIIKLDKKVGGLPLYASFTHPAPCSWHGCSIQAQQADSWGHLDRRSSKLSGCSSLRRPSPTCNKQHTTGEAPNPRGQVHVVIRLWLSAHDCCMCRRVDPYEPHRVWYTQRAKGTHKKTLNLGGLKFQATNKVWSSERRLCCAAAPFDPLRL